MIAHRWKGLGDREKEKPEAIAEQCYDVFVVDMYGKGVRRGGGETQKRP